ncbi:MAG: UDP-glucose 4-epimerase GalE [Anaerolineae bacterium]|nr:UDP-glucose 4-epimerase GalE [Anaerolineae bacterium]
MRILVTGGAGYIGSATTAHLLEAGHEVTVYDNLYRGHRAAVPGDAEFIHGDIGNSGTLDFLFQTHSFDAVVHFAALIEAGESMQQPARYIHANIVNSSVLLEKMAACNINKLVFSSTAAVFAGQDTPIKEDDPIGPNNLYGETKLMIERMIRWYHELCGLKYAVLRYFNACGAMVAADGTAIRGEDHTPETHLIPLTLQVPLGKRPFISIFGTDYPTRDGTCVRDYIHISDLAQAHVLAVEALDDRHAMTYNLGNGRGYTVREVIDTAYEITGHDIPIKEGERRPGDAPSLVASSENIVRELGWSPQHPDLRDIMQSAWAWHESHPNGYNDTK